MKRLGLTCVLLIVSTSVLLAQKDQRKRIAILDFDFASVQNWWGGNWDIGKGVADLVVTDLVNDGTYRLIERKALDSILAEQNFSNSDRSDPTTAARIGKLLGVSAIVVGSITQFGVEKKHFGLGGFGGNWGGFGAGKVGTTKGKAKVAIDARLVDVNTGEILAVAKGEGKSSRSGLLLGGAGGGSGGYGGGSVDMGSSNFRETILGEAVNNAVDDLCKQLISDAGKLPEVKIEVRGLVADVDGSTLILNVGTNNGVKVGDTLRLLRVERTVKDPATGKVLREITQEVGRCKVTQADAGSSVATVTSGSGIKVGDLVRNH